MIHVVAAFLLQASPPVLSLPDGPAKRAWSSTTPAAAAAALDPAIAAFAKDESWNSSATWKTWAADLSAEAAASAHDPARRTRLLLGALAQSRSEEAWDHFAALSGHGDWMLAALPALMPGVGAGHSPTDLPDGATLSPALPPLARPAHERPLGFGRLERREARLAGVHIGSAVVDVRVAVEYDGVQVDLEYKSGGPASAFVVLPELLDFEYSTVYVDWNREPQNDGPHTLAISGETPTLTVYGRCKPVRVDWPTTLPDALDPRLRLHGIEIELRPQDELEPRLRGLAAALAQLTALPVSVRVVPADRVAPPSSALALHLAAGVTRARRLRGILSTTEHFALRR